MTRPSPAAALTAVTEGLSRAADRQLLEHRRGRHSRQFDIEPAKSAVCGVDLGGSHTRLLATDLNGRLIGRHRTRTPTDLDPESLTRWLAGQIQQVVEPAGVELVSAAVAMPGVVDPNAVVVHTSIHLPQVSGETFTAGLREALGVPVDYDNDANSALRGEMTAGAARDVNAAVLLILDTGLGGAVGLNGEVLRGRTGMVGEFGLLPYADTTLEGLLSGPGLRDRARDRGGAIALPEEVFAPGAAPPLPEVRAEVRAGLGFLLTLVALAYEPDVVVMTGSMVTSVAPWFPDLSSELGKVVARTPRVVATELGDLAGAGGAAAAALRAAYTRFDTGLVDAS
ncbi:MAG: ROK family protein [Mycobacteriales bacterium]